MDGTNGAVRYCNLAGEPFAPVPSETTQTVQRRRSALDPTLSRIPTLGWLNLPTIFHWNVPRFRAPKGFSP